MNHNEEQIKERINQYIVENFLFDEDNPEISNELKLIEEGIVDSMGIFRLIAFLEEEFDIMIEPDEVVLENFETVDAIASLVTNVETAYA